MCCQQHVQQLSHVRLGHQAEQEHQAMSCLSGHWKGLLSSNDKRGSAMVIGCMSDVLTSEATTASVTSLTRRGMSSANLSGGKALHQDRIWRWRGLELAKKRSSRIKLAAASNVLLPCGFWMLALDSAVTDAQTFCSFASDNSHKVPKCQLGYKRGHAVLAGDAKS